MKEPFFTTGLDAYLRDIESEFREIPDERIRILENIGNYILSSINKKKSAELVYICTHNSRRSQFGQVWAIVAALYYGIDNIGSFSGGTESTEFNDRAVKAIQRTGIPVSKPTGKKDNPVYSILDRSVDAALFSKKFSDPVNPSADFCAIMVCSDADEACPIVNGASMRISLPYDDPKDFDGTDSESRKYDERCREIARDMFYVFNYVKQNT